MQLSQGQPIAATVSADAADRPSPWSAVRCWPWLGTLPSDPASHKRKVMQVNVATFLVLATLAVFGVVYALFLSGTIIIRLALWQAVPGCLAPLVWWLNARRQPLAASLTLIAVAMAVVAVPIVMGQGKVINTHGYFALIAAVIPIILDSARTWLTVCLSALNLALFIAFQLGVAPIHPEAAALPAHLREYLSVAVVGVCVSSLVVLIGINEWWSAHNERQLVRLASTDALTGLPNRRSFVERFEAERLRAQRDGTPLALAVLDLDHFKRTNDSLGHDGGDAALRHVCRVMASQLRPYDMLARLGGEEFGLLLTRMDDRSVLQVVERIRNAVAASSFSYQGQRQALTVSIGVATTPPDATLSQLMQHADAALYRAKADGRNRVREHPLD